MNNATFKLSQLKQQLTRLAGTMGGEFIPMVKVAADRVNALLPTIQKWAVEQQAQAARLASVRDYQSLFISVAEAERTAFGAELQQRVAMWREYGATEEQILAPQNAARVAYWQQKA